MGKDSTIEWTHHTFNPWWGCVKVSPGCQNCYAESLSKRWGYGIWGPAKTTSRRPMSDSYWKQPLTWNERAQKAGTRARVFCASMADVFEYHPMIDDYEWRDRLWTLVEQTEHLDWLLLTKRPENIIDMVPGDWLYDHVGFPSNVWIGTSVENQEQADKRIPELLKVPARVRFLSCEPLLGPVTLFDTSEGVLDGVAVIRDGGLSYSPGEPDEWVDTSYSGIDWVIVGGESGPKARPMHPDWARSLRDQCQEAAVPYFFKQWGEYWPSGGRLIEGKSSLIFGNEVIYRVGKHAAGRLLDEREWNEFPEVSYV